LSRCIPAAPYCPTPTAPVYSIDSYENPDVDDSSLTGTWIVVAESTSTYTTSRGIRKATEQARFSISFKDNLDGTVDAFYCTNDGTTWWTFNTDVNQFSVRLGRANVHLNIVNNTRFEGSLFADSSELTIESSSAAAVKVDNRYFEEARFSLGDATIEISSGGEIRSADMPIGCFEAGNTEGTYNSSPFSADYLIFYAFESLATDGASHRAELFKWSSGDDVGSSYSDSGNTPGVNPPFSVSGDGEGGDVIIFSRSDADGLVGEYSASREAFNADTARGSFDIPL